ncbi:sulfatase [Halobaculum marinum]|uniref:Sulfatase n=1 Tax=Halobaculum marinum TaxID=3031996 RepID=A0ABD5WY49_9EURY|nr:sulfatase [Halobaculum sp. DT55]
MSDPGTGTTDRNVIIISGDSLRYDRATDPEVMPYLTRRADEGLHFSNAVSNAGFTPGSFPSMMASRYPSSIDGIGIPTEGGVTTLAEELSEVGYECGVWSDNKFVGPDYNYDRGYATGSGYEAGLRDKVREYVDESSRLFALLEFGYMQIWQRVKNALTESHYYSTAADLNGRAQSWLEERDPDSDSVHLWLHYMDSHHPYEPPADWMPDDLETVSNRSEANNVTRRVCKQDGEGCTDAEIRDAGRLYDAECEYLDTQIESFVEDYLVPEGWLTEDDILVITSDHGEIIDDYETWGEFGHGNFFCEECTRVPLILDGPVESGERDGQVSLVDLVPTLLDLCGIDSPAEDLLMGRSLLDDPVETEPVFYDGTLDFHGARGQVAKRFNTEAVGEDTYLNTEYGDGDERIVDGDERHEELDAFVQEQLATCSELAADTKAIDPDSLQVEQHMKDLGYLE